MLRSLFLIQFFLSDSRAGITNMECCLVLCLLWVSPTLIIYFRTSSNFNESFTNEAIHLWVDFRTTVFWDPKFSIIFGIILTNCSSTSSLFSTSGRLLMSIWYHSNKLSILESPSHSLNPSKRDSKWYENGSKPLVSRAYFMSVNACSRLLELCSCFILASIRFSILFCYLK